MAREHTAHEHTGWVRVFELFTIANLHFWPRLFILGFAILGEHVGEAFPSWVVWVAGFFLLPWTTITYAITWSVYSDRVYGAEWAFVGIALLLDVFVWWSTLRED
jgi:hypothetical protein